MLDWYVVNDNVMGGRSQGDFEQESGGLILAVSIAVGIASESSSRRESSDYYAAS